MRFKAWALVPILCVFVTEIASCGVYRKVVAADQRAAVELMLGVRGSDRNAVSRYAAHPYFNYVGSSSYRFKNGTLAHNEAGFRAQPALADVGDAQAKRLVAVGGSTTYGMYFGRASRVWPAYVQTILSESGLPVQAINLGLPNYSTYELLGVTAMWAPEFKPDYVLIHTGLNDAFSVGFKDEGGPDNRYFRHAWSFDPPGAGMQRMMRWSYAARLLVMRTLPNLGDMTSAMQFAPPQGDLLERHIAAATGHYFGRNLKSLIALVRSFGAEPVLINMPLNPDFERRSKGYYGAVVQAVLRNNTRMKALAQSHQVPFVDLYSVMRESELFLDAAHVNQAGMTRKAEHVADALKRVIESASPPANELVKSPSPGLQ